MIFLGRQERSSYLDSREWTGGAPCVGVVNDVGALREKQMRKSGLPLSDGSSGKNRCNASFPSQSADSGIRHTVVTVKSKYTRACRKHFLSRGVSERE